MIPIGFIAETDKGEIITYGENGEDILIYPTLEDYEDEEGAEGIDIGEDHLFEPFFKQFTDSIKIYFAANGYNFVEIHLIPLEDTIFSWK